MWLAFRDRLPQWLQDELDHLVASIRSYLFTEHNQDGTHANVTADSVTIRDGSKGLTIAPDLHLRQEGDRSVLRSPDPIDVYSGIRQTVPDPWRVFSVGNTTPNAPGSPLNRSLVDFQCMTRLRLGDPVSVTAFPPGDRFFGLQGSDTGGADKILYRAAPSGNASIGGIYTPLNPDQFPEPQAGQMVVVWNDSAFDLTFDGAGGTSADYATFVGPAFTIGPQGCAIFVYDVLYTTGTQVGGWRPISIVGAPAPPAPVWTDYTPVFASSGTQPSLGTGGSISGQYLIDGPILYFRAGLTLGTGFSFGTGTLGITLPFAASTSWPLSTDQIWPTQYNDTGTNGYKGIGWYSADLNGNPAVTLRWQNTNGLMSLVAAANPFTWAATDRMSVSGFYRV